MSSAPRSRGEPVSARVPLRYLVPTPGVAVLTAPGLPSPTICSRRCRSAWWNAGASATSMCATMPCARSPIAFVRPAPNRALGRSWQQY